MGTIATVSEGVSNMGQVFHGGLVVCMVSSLKLARKGGFESVRGLLEVMCDGWVPEVT